MGGTSAGGHEVVAKKVAGTASEALIFLADRDEFWKQLEMGKRKSSSSSSSAAESSSTLSISQSYNRQQQALLKQKAKTNAYNDA